MSVGHWRMGLRATGGVPAFVGPVLADDCLPSQPAALPGHRQHGVFMAMRHWHAVVHTRGLIEHGLLGLAHRGGGHHDHPISEDDGRGVSLARQRKLPADVVGFAPLQGRLGRRRDARGQGAPPLRPSQCSTVHRRRCDPWRRDIRCRFGAQEAGASGRDQDPGPPLPANLHPQTSAHHARGVARPGARRDRNPARRPGTAWPERFSWEERDGVADSFARRGESEARAD